MKITVEFDSLAEFNEFQAWKLSRPAKQKTPLQGSGLSYRAINSLMSLGVAFVEDTISINDGELLRLPNIGRGTVKEIRQRYAALATQKD